LTADRRSSTTERDHKCSRVSRVKSSQQQQQQHQSVLARGTSFELDTSSSSLTPTIADETVVSHRRSSVMTVGGGGRRGSQLVLHGQLSLTSSESSTSTSSTSSSGGERRRSSCLSDVSVRSSGSSKRSSISSELLLDDYFEPHRSLQTAVIEEEVTSQTTEGHDATQSSAASQQRVAGKPARILEHFVDNLMNEAAQQCKTELDKYLTDRQRQVPAARSSQPLDQYASALAEHIVTDAVRQAAVRQRRLEVTRCSDVTQRRLRLQRQQTTTDQQQTHAGLHSHAGTSRVQRQQTVSGFRDTLLSDFDNKLMTSNVNWEPPSDQPARIMVTVGSTTTSSAQRRRASEPAYLLTTASRTG